MRRPGETEPIRLFGTDEPPPERRTLIAGPLSAELEAGGLRYIRWEGFEVLRGIAFVARDSRWGTYRLEIADLSVTEEPGRFEATYRAHCAGPEGRFEFSARIVGSENGRLRFEAEGSSPTGFLTNRTGFVVLHPLEGAAGRPVMLTDGSGAERWSRFPEMVAPDQPMTDISRLRHEPKQGLRISVGFEGEVFETEDHRNWTDASFKTYVRPLERGFPYRIEAHERVMQAIDLGIEGRASARPLAADDEIRLDWAAAPGTPLPRFGLFLDPSQDRPPPEVIARIAAMRPGYLQVRADLRASGSLERLGGDLALAASLGCPIHLDAVIPGIEPGAELAALAAFLSSREASLDVLFAIPARDCASRRPGHLPDGEASAERILDAARALFPGATIAGGVPVGFPEFNRNRPPAGADLIAHATQAIVHAADDRSVMETLEALPHLIRTARSYTGSAGYRLGPSTIGMPSSTSSSPPVTCPDNRRTPRALNDPRQRGAFAAAFAIGLAAAAADVSHITLAALTGPFGIVHAPQPWPTPECPDGADYPIAEALEILCHLAERPRLSVTRSGTGRIAALGALAETGPQICLANLTAERVTVTIDLPRRLASGTQHSPLPGSVEGFSAPRLAMRLELGPYALASASAPSS